MSVWWFIAAAIVITAIGRHRSRQIQHDAQQRAEFREQRLREELHREAETLWPDSNADRWPAPGQTRRVETPAQRAYVDAGVTEAEQWANHG